MVVGWRLLNETQKPAWMLGFKFKDFNLFPGLFPGRGSAGDKTSR